MVVKPDDFPLRFGATIRAAVSASQTQANATTSSGIPMIPPARAVLPWELELGFAFQLGPRPLNPPWLEPSAMERPVRSAIERARAERRAAHEAEIAQTPPAEREAKRRAIDAGEDAVRSIEDQRMAVESARLHAIRQAREQNWPRERILIVGGLLMTGASDNAVALEGFINQQRELVGQHLSLSPRIGLESEPIPNWLHGRIGSYIEPSRFEDGYGRQHFTCGADIKLFPFSPWGIFGDQVWRLSFSMDMAPRYQNFGVGIGAWH